MLKVLAEPRALLVLFLLTAAATVLTQSARQATQRYIILAESSDTSEVDVFIGDDPDQYPPNDCGHSVSLHIIRLMANDREDHCTIGRLSRDEFVRRIAEWMNQRGVQIEFPNGITTEELQGLARTPLFVEGAKAVLAEFARAHGFDVMPKTFLGPFPFDAFFGP